MILKNRNFRWLWTGQLVSKIGSQFNYIALAWLVLESTKSAAATSGVFLAQVLPAALLGWIAGVAVDRFDRRHLMIHCDWLRALLVLILPLSFFLHDINNWLIFAVTFAVSLLSLVFYAAEKAILPHLIPADDLPEANAFAEMTEQIGALAGPVLAGALIAVLPSPVYILYLDVASFIFSAFTIYMLNCPHAVPSTAAAGNSVKQIMREAKDGVVWLFRNPLLRTVLLTAAAINITAAPFSVVFPLFSERVLHAGSFGFGCLMSGFGTGMLVGSLLTAPIVKRLSPANIIYGGMVLLGLGFLAMGFSTNLWVATALAFIAALGVGPGNAVIVTLMQNNTPEELLGRTFASMSGLVQGAIPLGVAIMAFVLDYSGANIALLIMGLSSIAFALIGYYCLIRHTATPST